VGFPAPACTEPELKSFGQSKNVHGQRLPEICSVIHHETTILAAFCQAMRKSINFGQRWIRFGKKGPAAVGPRAGWLGFSKVVCEAFQNFILAQSTRIKKHDGF